MCLLVLQSIVSLGKQGGCYPMALFIDLSTYAPDCWSLIRTKRNVIMLIRFLLVVRTHECPSDTKKSS